MTFEYDVPEIGFLIFDVSGLAHKKIIGFIGKKFGQTGFPKSVDAYLVGELAVAAQS